MNDQETKGWNRRSECTTQSPYLNTNHSIDLHIEELVLHGFASGDRYRISEGLKLELNRLFTEQGIPSLLRQNNNVASIHGGTLSLLPGNKPETIGMQVAQKVYRGLDQ